MKNLSLLLALFVTVSSGCHTYNNRWCDEISKLDCNVAPHNQLVHMCGSDGITYYSGCALNKASCEKKVALAYKGKCAYDKEEETKFEKLVCSYVDQIICHGIDPICGSDQVSYDNVCELVKAHCKNKDIVEAHKGFCAPVTTNAPVTTPVTLDDYCKSLMKKACHGVNPLCGSDNVTYDNGCEFEKNKCIHPELRIKKMDGC